MHLSDQTVWQHMVVGGDLADFCRSVPPETREWVIEVWDRLTHQYYEQVGQIRTTYHTICREVLVDRDTTHESFRKNFEQVRAAYGADPLVYRLVDGKSLFEPIMRRIKPLGSTPES